MDTLFITCNKEKVCESSDFFMGYFKGKYNCLDNVDLLFPIDDQDNDVNSYFEYESDLKELYGNDLRKEHQAWLEDHREDGFWNAVRLLLPNSFFEHSNEYKASIVLHELGHYYTNPTIREFRHFVKVFFPPQFKVSDNCLSKMNEENWGLVKRFNETASLQFKPFKLVEEIHAELWAYDMCRQSSYNKLKSSLTEVVALNKGTHRPQDTLSGYLSFYYTLLWNQTVLKLFDFDYSKQYEIELEESFSIFDRIMEEKQLKHLKIFDQRSRIIKAIKSEDILTLISISLLLVQDHIDLWKEGLPEFLMPDLDNYGNLYTQFYQSRLKSYPIKGIPV
jgi:hypothetical protein